MLHRNGLPCIRALFYMTLSAIPASWSVAHASWQPNRSVEIIVGAGPGGGQDRSARAIQGAIMKNRLIEVPVLVSNKPGGGAILALDQLVQRKSDPHVLQLLTPSLIINNVMGASPHGHATITPIAVVFDEYIATAVRSGSPIRDGRDLLSRLRTDPASLSIAISGRGTGSHLAMAMLAREAGVDPARMRFVVFKSGGESVTAVLGGHVDAMVSTFSPVAGAAEDGKLRVIALTAPKRMSGAQASVPTWRELGYSTEFSNWRAVVGPPGLTAAQVSFWDGIFDRLVKTSDFNADVQANHAVANYRNSGAAKQFLQESHAMLRQLLADIGMTRSN